MVNIILTEEQLRQAMLLLTEDKESKNLAKARRVVKSLNPNADANRVVDAIRHDITNSRINHCKFLPGIARMFMNGELKDGKTILDFDTTLEFIGTAHDDEYDGNLNNEPASALIEKFRPAIRANVEAKKAASAKREYRRRSDYKVVPIPSFEEAEKYGEYTAWCVTQASRNYDTYTHGGIGIFYFLLKDGFEKVPAVRGEGCPRDEYGMSMIAVSINDDGSMNTSTCRWNHSNGGNDHLFTDDEISELIGADMYQVLKPRNIKILADTDRFKVIEKEAGHVVAYDKELERYTDFTNDGTAPFTDSWSTQGVGRIGLNGEVIVQPKYFAVWPFESDGCAKVMNYAYGLVTREGKEIFDVGVNGSLNYLSSASSSGTRMYRDDNGNRGLINMKLNKHIKSGEFSTISEVEPDNKFVVINHQHQNGLLNDDLSWAIPFGVYDNIEFMDEHDMLRTVSNGTEQPNIRYGLVNEKNEIVLPLKFDFIMDECSMERGEQVYSRAVVINRDGARMRGRVYKLPDGSVCIKWRNGQLEHYYPQKQNNTVTESINEEKIVVGKMYMHKSQAERIIPANIYNTSLQILRKQYPDYQYNCIMYAPKANIVRFDYSEDFNTNTEPSIKEMISVNYVTGETKIGRPTPAVWHERSFWVDNDYNEFDRDKDREWVQTYRNAIKKKPYYGKTPQGGSRSAWMNHLMNLGIIDKYFEVNGIQNPEEYLENIKPSPKFSKGFLVNKYRKKYKK